MDLEQLKQQLEVLYPHKVAIDVHKQGAVYKALRTHAKNTSITKFLNELGYSSIRRKGVRKPTNGAYTGQFTEDVITEQLLANYPDKLVLDLAVAHPKLYSRIYTRAYAEGTTVACYLEKLGFIYPSQGLFRYKSSGEVFMLTEQDLIDMLTELYPLKVIAIDSTLDDALKQTLAAYGRYRGTHSFVEALELLGFLYVRRHSLPHKSPLRDLHDKLLERYPNRQLYRFFIDDADLYNEISSIASESEGLSIQQFVNSLGFFYSYANNGGKYTEESLIEATRQLTELYPHKQVYLLRKLHSALFNLIAAHAKINNMSVSKLIGCLGFEYRKLSDQQIYKINTEYQLKARLAELYPEKIVFGISVKDKLLATQLQRYANHVGMTTAELLDDLGFVSRGFPTNNILRLKYIIVALELKYPDALIEEFRDMSPHLRKQIKIHADIFGLTVREVVESLDYRLIN